MDLPDEIGDSCDVSPDQVQDALLEILQSAPFRASKQSQRLLQYVVSGTLDGHEELLKERLIGVNVFGRKPNYNTGDDPIVRVRAADTRKRLAQYYSGQGAKSSIRITVYPGSYRPVFSRARFEKHPERDGEATSKNDTDKVCVTPAQDRGVSLVRKPYSPRSRRYPALWLAVVAFCILVLATLRFMKPNQTSAIDLMWAPMLTLSKPVLIYMGTDAVYAFSSQFLDRYRQTRHIENNGPELYVDLPPGSRIEATDLTPEPGSFVMGNDVAAAGRMIAYLTRKNRFYDLRWGQDISSGDLRTGAVILIGGFNNQWTLEKTNNLRFVFEYGTQIRDKQRQNVAWSIAFDTTGKTTDDYAVITRLVGQTPGTSIFMVAGIGQCGTEAAGEFLTDPQAITRMAKELTPGWKDKSMQILLHIKVVHNYPSAVDVIGVSLL